MTLTKLIRNIVMIVIRHLEINKILALNNSYLLYIYIYIYTHTHTHTLLFAQSAGAVEYTDCTSAEG